MMKRELRLHGSCSRCWWISILCATLMRPLFMLTIWKLKPGNEQIKNYSLHKMNLICNLWRFMPVSPVPTFLKLLCSWLEPRRRASSSWISSMWSWMQGKTSTTTGRSCAFWIKPLLTGEIKLDKEPICFNTSNLYSCLLRPAGSTVLKQLSQS